MAVEIWSLCTKELDKMTAKDDDKHLKNSLDPPDMTALTALRPFLPMVISSRLIYRLLHQQQRGEWRWQFALSAWCSEITVRNNDYMMNSPFHKHPTS